MICSCGTTVVSHADKRVCQQCGAPCCTSCALTFDAANYFTPCAEAVLAGEEPSAVHPAAAMVWSRSGPRHDARGRAEMDDKAQWIILVARDQPDLYEHLERAFSHDDKVAVVMDRRRDYSRNRPGLESRLRTHGAAVVRRKES